MVFVVAPEVHWREQEGLELYQGDQVKEKSCNPLQDVVEGQGVVQEALGHQEGVQVQQKSCLL